MSDQKQMKSPALPKLNQGKAQMPTLPVKGKAPQKKTESAEMPKASGVQETGVDETVLLVQPALDAIDKEFSLQSEQKSAQNALKPTLDKAEAPRQGSALKPAVSPPPVSGLKGQKTARLIKPQLSSMAVSAPEQTSSAEALNKSSDEETDNNSAMNAAPKKPPFPPQSGENAKATKGNDSPVQSGENAKVIKGNVPPAGTSRPKPPVPPSRPVIAAPVAPAAPAATPNPSAVDVELPQEWLEGKGVYLPKETAFSSPNLITDPVAQQNTPTSSNLNVDLEVRENLPDELAKVIAEYDNEIRDTQTRDGIRECTIQLAIARILEYTGYEKLAYVRYLKALEANHFSRTAIHELRRIARAYNKTSDVITLLQSEIDTNISPEEQAIFLEECALLTYFSDVKRRPDAINMLHRAAALAPKCITPVSTLTYLLLFEERYTECCSALEKVIALTNDRETQVACYCIKGDLESSMLPGASEGQDSYLRALELSPGMLYAFQHAMSIFLRQKNWQTLYTRAVAFAKDSKDKIISHAAMVLAGSIAVDLLSDFVGSNIAYEQAQKYVPDDVLPLELQADNNSSDPSKWKEYDEALCKLIQVTNIPKERTELIIIRAINLDRNGKAPGKAIEVLKEVIHEQPCDRLVMEYYFALLKNEGKLAEAMQFTKRFIEMSSAEDAAARYASLGCYCYDVLKNYDDAESNFRNALALDPNQRIAFEYLEQMLRARNDYEGIARLYRARLNVALDARTRASMLYTLACLYDYVLGQPENAIFYLKLYREIYPDDIHAIHSLQKQYLRMKSWKELIEALLIEMNTAATMGERCSLLIRVASICRYKLCKLDYAAAFLRQAKEENPSSMLVYCELEDILTESRNWKELVSVLTEKLALQKSNSDRIVTLNKIALIQRDYLCDNKEATVCFEQILKIDPDNVMAASNLSNIYKQTGNFAAYYELALDRAQRITIPAQKCRYLFKIALKTLTLFNEPEQAMAILELAQAADPNYTPVVFLLLLVYGANLKTVELINVLQDYTNSAKNQSTKSACALTISYLYNWIHKSPEEAIHPLELSLALSPEAMNARFMLIHAQYKRGNAQELAALFMEGAQNVRDKTLSCHYYNLAALAAHSFPEMSGAFESEVSALKSAVEIDPDNIIANERLESMEPCRANLVPFIEKRIKTASPEDKTELQFALVESTYPDMPQKAFAMICDIIKENPTHLPALRVGANMAQKLNNLKMLCHFLAMQAPLLANIPMRIITWTNAAKLARDQLNQPELACEYFKQAFLLAPQSMELCDQLLALLEKTNNIAAIESILQLHTRSISKEDQVRRYAQMADEYLNTFNEPTQAIVKLRQILELQPDRADVLWKLAQIELSLQHWNEARNAIVILLENGNGAPELLQEARLALASIYVDQLCDGSAATPLLQDVLTNDPGNIQAIELIASIYVKESRYNEALAQLLRLNSLLPPPTNIRALLQIANIYLALKDTEKLTQLMREAAALVFLKPDVLQDIQPWISKCKDPVVLRAFIESLLEHRDFPQETMVDIYEFVAFCYAGPLHMRFEADKYAVAAATLAPNSLRTQLLAAKVFDPKEAMSHATAAAAISPLSIEPYQAMLQIAINANRPDLQGRVEQQIVVLNPQFKSTDAIQTAFTSRIPEKPGLIDDAMILSMSPHELNSNIIDLLRLAAARAQIFEVPMLPSEPLSTFPVIEAIFNRTAAVFGCNCTARLVKDAPFMFSISPASPDEILLNSTMLSSCSDAEARFHISAAMLNFKLGTLPLITLPPDNVTMLISGLLGLFDSKYTSPNVLSRIKSFLPRNVRKSVVELITTRGISAFQYDPGQLMYDAHMLAIYFGHAFSANLVASVSALIRAKNPNVILAQNPGKWVSHFANTPYLAELLAYNPSERYSDLRQRLGIFMKMNS